MLRSQPVRRGRGRRSHGRRAGRGAPARPGAPGAHPGHLVEQAALRLPAVPVQLLAHRQGHLRPSARGAASAPASSPAPAAAGPPGLPRAERAAAPARANPPPRTLRQVSTLPTARAARSTAIICPYTSQAFVQTVSISESSTSAEVTVPLRDSSACDGGRRGGWPRVPSELQLRRDLQGEIPGAPGRSRPGAIRRGGPRSRGSSGRARQGAPDGDVPLCHLVLQLRNEHLRRGERRRDVGGKHPWD